MFISVLKKKKKDKNIHLAVCLALVVLQDIKKLPKCQK